MKIRELIEELKKCDPEAIVSCGHQPVWFVEQMASYWDGYNAEVTKNKEKWIYNLDKDKVVIRSWDEDDFVSYFFDDKTIPKFEEIEKSIVNLPNERYLKAFKKAYEIYKAIYEKKEALKNK